MGDRRGQVVASAPKVVTTEPGTCRQPAGCLIKIMEGEVLCRQHSMALTPDGRRAFRRAVLDGAGTDTLAGIVRDHTAD